MVGQGCLWETDNERLAQRTRAGLAGGLSVVRVECLDALGAVGHFAALEAGLDISRWGRSTHHLRTVMAIVVQVDQCGFLPDDDVNLLLVAGVVVTGIHGFKHIQLFAIFVVNSVRQVAWAHSTASALV